MTPVNLPLVTVCIPAYNHEKYIVETIESVLNQTYPNIELIIINDGSKDKTNDLIEMYRNKCEKKLAKYLYINRENQGVARTLNECINKSKGDFISFLASDDIFTHDKIEVLMNLFSELDNEYGLICGNALFIDENSSKIELDKKGKKFSNVIEYFIFQKKNFNIESDFGKYKTLLAGNYIPAMSCIIRKNALIECGLFEESISIEDWDLWLKLSKNHKFYYSNQVVAYYRMHTANSIKTQSNKLIIDSLKILKREYEYSKKNFYINDWENRYYGLFIVVLKNKKFELLKYFNHFNLLKFIKFIANKI